MALAPPGHVPDWTRLEVRLLLGYVCDRLSLEDLRCLLGPRLQALVPGKPT